MSDEEIERELKRVQLQREKIQLENDISRMQRASNISDAISKSGIYIKYLSRNFFKVFIFIAFFFIAIYGISVLEDSRKRDVQKKSFDYAIEACGEIKNINACMLEEKISFTECITRQEDRVQCQLRARKQF